MQKSDFSFLVFNLKQYQGLLFEFIRIFKD